VERAFFLTENNSSEGHVQPRPDTDEDLMESCAQGSEQAFNLLVERYKARVVNLVFRFIGDTERSQEIAQEVFLRVYIHRRKYRIGGKFSTWIFTIAANLAKNELRYRGRRKNVVSLESLEEAYGGEIPELGDDSENPLDRAELSNLSDVIADALEQLPPKHRMAVVLRDIEGLSYEEITDVLKIPGGTVRSRINRGRLMLKEILKPYVEREDV
jgi:RNA polymerase sigma-70 factor (ECF subfamily)